LIIINHVDHKFIKMHYHGLLIIPKDVYEKGHIAINDYIYEQLAPYSENLKVDEYIKYTKAQLEKEFAEFKADQELIEYHAQYPSLDDFCTKWHGYDLDSNGNAISTFNPKAFWDWYEIGGRWSGELTNKTIPDFDKNSYSALELHFINRMPYNIKNNSMSVCDLLLKHKNDNETYKVLLHDSTDYVATLEKYIDDYAISIDYHN
jgi:hypothetical protein